MTAKGTKGHHSADDKSVIPFFYRIETKTRQVDGLGNASLGRQAKQQQPPRTTAPRT